MTIPVDLQQAITQLLQEKNAVYEHMAQASDAHSQMRNSAPTANTEALLRHMHHHHQMAQVHLGRANAILELIGEHQGAAIDNCDDLDLAIEALESKLPA